MKAKDYRKKTQSPLQFHGKFEREARYIEDVLAHGQMKFIGYDSRGKQAYKRVPITGKREKQLKADLERLRKKSPRLLYNSRPAGNKYKDRPARRIGPSEYEKR